MAIFEDRIYICLVFEGRRLGLDVQSGSGLIELLCLERIVVPDFLVIKSRNPCRKSKLRINDCWFSKESISTGQ